VGSTAQQAEFWNVFFEKLEVLPLDSDTVKVVSEISKRLKSSNNMIEIPDILIAATAISNGISLATKNTKHFQRIDELSLLNIPE
jgi:tRNA(fMet)-specific endonuclease VapC